MEQFLHTNTDIWPRCIFPPLQCRFGDRGSFGGPLFRYLLSGILRRLRIRDSEDVSGRGHSRLYPPLFSDGYRSRGWEIGSWGRDRLLGLLGPPPCSANDNRLRISLPPERRNISPSLTDIYIREAEIPHIFLERLIGRFPFAQTSIFWEFARTKLRPLYQKFHRRVYNDRLSSAERGAFRRRSSVISDFTHRIATPRPSRTDWLIYTDASSTPFRLCAMLFRGASASPSLHTQCSADVDVTWPYLLRRTNLIFGLELLALVLFFDDSAPS